MKKIFAFMALAGLSGFAFLNSGTTETKVVAAEKTNSTKKVKLVQADANMATLKFKVVYDGKAPDPSKIDQGNRDAFCADIDLKSDALLVGADGALANFVIYLDAKRSKIKVPKEVEKGTGKVLLDNKGCMFEPHVLMAQPGQTVVVTNSDATGHNANFNFFNNTPVNFIVPNGTEKTVELSADEPSPIPVECNVHPWMRAYIVIQEHPYVGISDENGVIEIANIPPGEATFRVWHEYSDGAIDKANVNGKDEKWSRGRMEVELKPGMNDLGVIKIAADKFKK